MVAFIWGLPESGERFSMKNPISPQLVKGAKGIQETSETEFLAITLSGFCNSEVAWGV